jgi:mannitol-specific phosphotransferase system IIBC component
MADQGEPRLLRRIVFGYTVECFPGMLILGYNQLKRMLARGEFDVKINLAPLNDLPSDTDILFVPPELREPAEHVTCVQVQVLEDYLNHPAYTALMQQLNDGVGWRACKIAEPPAPEQNSQSVRYRGYERIE